MKKIYKKPQVLVAVIENEMILAGSDPEVTIDLSNPVNRMESKKAVLDWDE